MGLLDGLLGRLNPATLLKEAILGQVPGRKAVEALVVGADATVDLPDTLDIKFQHKGNRYSIDQVVVRRLR
jgi:hypothetical protein